MSVLGLFDTIVPSGPSHLKLLLGHYNDSIDDPVIYEARYRE